MRNCKGPMATNWTSDFNKQGEWSKRADQIPEWSLSYKYFCLLQLSKQV